MWAQIWPKLVSDANRIIEEANIELDEDWNHATVEEGIKVNGPEDYGHESFLLLPNKKGFDFCKTAQKPYDLVVTTILIRARMLAGAATFRLRFASSCLEFGVGANNCLVLMGMMMSGPRRRTCMRGCGRMMCCQQFS